MAKQILFGAFVDVSEGYSSDEYCPLLDLFLSLLYFIFLLTDVLLVASFHLTTMRSNVPDDIPSTDIFMVPNDNMNDALPTYNELLDKEENFLPTYVIACEKIH